MYVLVEIPVLSFWCCFIVFHLQRLHFWGRGALYSIILKLENFIKLEKQKKNLQREMELFLLLFLIVKVINAVLSACIDLNMILLLSFSFLFFLLEFVAKISINCLNFKISLFKLLIELINPPAISE